MVASPLQSLRPSRLLVPSATQPAARERAGEHDRSHACPSAGASVFLPSMSRLPDAGSLQSNGVRCALVCSTPPPSPTWRARHARAGNHGDPAEVRHMARRSRARLRAGRVAPGGVEPPLAASKAAALSAELRGRAGPGGVTDGTRTHNHRDHNPGLYQLSYGHRAADSLATEFERDMTNASFRSRWVARRFRASGVSTRSRPPQCSKLLGRRLPGSGVPRCTEDRLGRVVSLADAQQRALERSPRGRDRRSSRSPTSSSANAAGDDLQADMEPFVRDGERAAAGAGPAPRKKNDVIIRRFYRDGDESEKHTFLARRSDAAGVGSADAAARRRLGVPERLDEALLRRQLVHAFPTRAQTGGSPPSSWHRDPEEEHVVKAFLYVGDVDEGDRSVRVCPLERARRALRPPLALARRRRDQAAGRTSSRRRLRPRTGRSAPVPAGHADPVRHERLPPRRLRALGAADLGRLDVRLPGLGAGQEHRFQVDFGGREDELSEQARFALA